MSAGLRRLAGQGTGAQRQRLVFAEHADLDEVVRDAGHRTLTPP
ncbi:MAG: hypothetical protein ACR2N4_09990 [Jatrophihabitans sp.]